MTYTMTVSPDFPPNQIAGWYIFNTWLQKQLKVNIHLELYDSFDAQREAIAQDKIDLIYANPYDASTLVRQKQFTGMVRPESRQDEAVIAVSGESDIYSIEALKPDVRIAKTDDPDVNMIGMIMLEPADLSKDNTSAEVVDTYALVAKRLLNGDADVGFFLKDAFDKLSPLIKRQLNVLVSSQIGVVNHVFMLGPRLARHKKIIQAHLLSMSKHPAHSSVLEGLGISGWKVQDDEDTEFMIDLMDTLVD